MGSDVPVLVMVFNRPDTTAQVLEALSEVRPRRVFIAGDGPRQHVPSDRDLVAQTQKLVGELITWDAEVMTLFRDDNLGCRRAVLEAVDWFFENVDEGIILEDDCVPHPDYFPYCEELLARYRSDEQLFAILGDNSLKMPTRRGASYDFFKYCLPFGSFATWKRVWDKHDRDLDTWSQIRNTSQVKKLWPDRIERKIHTEILDRLLANPEQIWDCQWSYSCDSSGSLTIYPATNLVSNVGFARSDSTHYKGASIRGYYPVGPIMPLKHPHTINRNTRAERKALNGRLWGASKYRWWRGLELARRALRKRVKGALSLLLQRIRPGRVNA